MSKPGDREGAARARSRGLDLTGAAMTPEQAARAGEEMELHMGMRCHGCGRRITAGLRFTSIAPRDAQMPVISVSACTRKDCNYAEKARVGATVVEMVEFAWLDDVGADARPAVLIVERNARQAARSNGQPAGPA